MDTTLVILHHGGKWVEDRNYIDYEVVGIPVPFDCTYAEIRSIIHSALDLDPSIVAIDIRFELQKGISLAKFVNNNSVSFFLELKKKYEDVAGFPLIIDATPISKGIRDDSSSFIDDLELEDIGNSENSKLVNESENFTTKSRKSIEDIAQEVYECVEQNEQINVDVDNEVDNEVQPVVTSLAVFHMLTENQVFQHKKLMKICIAKYAMANMFQFKVKKSDSIEYVLICVDDGCRWSCRVSKVGKTSMFKVRYIRNDHTCRLDTIMGDHPQASSSTIAHIIKHKYESTRTIYTPGDIMNDMLTEYGDSISYDKALRSQEKAYELLTGDLKESYQNLPSYLHMLQVANPGSTTKIEIDSSNRFKYLFMALGASIQGWEFCKPVIVVDGTQLKGRYGGTLFTACTQDTDNNIFILGFGVGDSENNDSWKWFMNRIKETYGEREGLCVVSDRHPSIEVAVEEVYPNVLHGACSVHLLKNLKRNFPNKVKNVGDPFHAAVRAYTEAAFEYQMAEMDKINDGIRGYLKESGYEKWSRAYMTTNRYSVMTSNIVESVNAVIKIAKKKHIEALLECLRYVLQRWFSKNREKATNIFTTLAFKQESILREKTQESMKMKVIASTSEIYKVKRSGKSNLVNLQEKTCTCRRFQIDQMPCAHALAVISKRYLSSYDYCSSYYTKLTYARTYSGTVLPLGDRATWTVPPHILNIEVKPPIPSRRAGRPKENRIPSKGESKRVVKCGRCKNYGHNRKTCKNSIPLSELNEKKSKKKRKRHE